MSSTRKLFHPLRARPRRSSVLERCERLAHGLRRPPSPPPPANPTAIWPSWSPRHPAIPVTRRPAGTGPALGRQPLTGEGRV
ncbi:hypothetical protein ABVK25_012427, partial [Lepraria finkii]